MNQTTPPDTISNDGDGLAPLQDPLQRVIHPLLHANGATTAVQQVPSWLDTPENKIRAMRTFLELLGLD